MGKIKYIQDIRSFFKKNVIVDINSLKKFIPKKRKDYIYLLINNMLKKGEIKRITKGYYSLEEDPSLAVFCFKPSYLGLQNALSIHNLWEQETNPIIITTQKIRQGIRKVSENNIVLHRISPKYFFGIDYIKEGNIYFPVSNIEKTFIDLIYFNQNIDKKTLKEFKKRINNKRIKIYLKKYSENISSRVLDKIS
ncbi:hypothetical protein J4443_00020 [Candidatus Woesearchaeota archaeon]|nr:hypothetical protein [Candidatus Woesearchaeota archaeon]